MDQNNHENSAELIGFKEELADIQTAIADFESGRNLNVAIISEPFGGRTTLMNRIEQTAPQNVTSLSFSSLIKNKAEIILPEQHKRIVLIDDCQFLYMRKIGGFDVLEEFLGLVSDPAVLFITAWNSYSWKYLDEVMEIGKFFPVRISLPKLKIGQLKEIILSEYKEDEIKFVEDVEFEKDKIIEHKKFQVPISALKKTMNVPYFKINYNILKMRLLKQEQRLGAQDIVFEKIHRISNGNPGVAKIIWLKSLEYPVIKPGKIKDETINIELDYYESFALNIILAMKCIKKDDLSGILGPDHHIDKIIFQLSKQRLIAVENGSCSVKAEALKSIVEFLKKSRLVW